MLLDNDEVLSLACTSPIYNPQKHYYYKMCPMLTMWTGRISNLSWEDRKEGRCQKLCWPMTKKSWKKTNSSWHHHQLRTFFSLFVPERPKLHHQRRSKEVKHKLITTTSDQTKSWSTKTVMEHKKSELLHNRTILRLVTAKSH